MHFRCQGLLSHSAKPLLEISFSVLPLRFGVSFSLCPDKHPWHPSSCFFFVIAAEKSTWSVLDRRRRVWHCSVCGFRDVFRPHDSNGYAERGSRGHPSTPSLRRRVWLWSLLYPSKLQATPPLQPKLGGMVGAAKVVHTIAFPPFFKITLLLPAHRLQSRCC